METKQHFLQKTWVVWILAMVCCAFWGSAFSCIKLGYHYFEIASEDMASQILFAGCRFFLAGILSVLIGSMLSRKVLLPKKQSFPMIFALCLFQTVLQYLFFYVGLAHATGVKSSIINGSGSFVTILVASLIFRQEKLTAQKIWGCILGTAGVVLVNLVGAQGFDFQMTFWGEGFILLSCVASAFSSTLMKPFSAKENPVVLSGYQFILGGFLMAVCGFGMGGRILHFPVAGVLLWIHLAFVSAIAYSLWSILIKYNPVSKVTVFGFMTPIFGVLLSAILLGETKTLGIESIAALLLVCIGIYIVNRNHS